jgi:hypothetical protein
MNKKKQYSAAVTEKYLPEDDLIGWKHVVEVTFIKRDDDVAQQQSRNTTRSCTLKTAPANEIVNQCNRMLKYNTINYPILPFCSAGGRMIGQFPPPPPFWYAYMVDALGTWDTAYIM